VQLQPTEWQLAAARPKQRLASLKVCPFALAVSSQPLSGLRSRVGTALLFLQAVSRLATSLLLVPQAPFWLSPCLFSLTAKPVALLQRLATRTPVSSLRTEPRLGQLQTPTRGRNSSPCVGAGCNLRANSCSLPLVGTSYAAAGATHCRPRW